MKRRVAQFASEAEMCRLFIEVMTGEISNGTHRARPTGWKAYPEVWGDILMVRDDGFQIGIEAKLRLNDDVIMQAMDGGTSYLMSAGPDCRAVLVPHGSGSALHRIACQRFGLQVITITAAPEPYQPLVVPELPRPGHWLGDGYWPEMLPVQRVTLPPVVPDVVAGRPAPIQLTAWKVKAIKIAIVLEKRGWLCRQDFKHVQIDHRRFLDSGWLAVVDGAWRAGPGWPDFKRQHPRNYDEIAALYDDWKPAEPGENFGRLV